MHAGVCLRVDTGHFRVFPYENPYLAPFELAVRTLNPVVAVKIRSATVHAALATVAEDAAAIYIDVDTRIQILDSILLLGSADKEQCGAFIVSRHLPSSVPSPSRCLPSFHLRCNADSDGSVMNACW